MRLSVYGIRYAHSRRGEAWYTVKVDDVHGAVCMEACLRCTVDVASSVRFYIETLGLKLVEETPEASVLDAGDAFLIELRQGTPGQTAPVTLFPKVPLAEAIAIYALIRAFAGA